LDFSTIDSEFILNELQVDESYFLDKLHILEGVGLFQTYSYEEEIYIEVYAPKSPSDFLDNVVFNQLLKDKVSINNFEVYGKIFQKNIELPANKKNISSHLSDVFPSILQSDGKTVNVSNLIQKVTLDIDKKTLSKLLADNQIKKEVLSPELFELVKYYSIVDGLSYERILECIKLSYNDKLFDEANFRILLADCHYLNAKVESQNTLSVSDSLSVYFVTTDAFIKAKYSQATPSEQVIIDDVKNRYNFSDYVINVLIDKTFAKCDGRLNKKYLESLCISLTRKKIKNVDEAYMHLNRDHSLKPKVLEPLIVIEESKEPKKSIEEAIKGTWWEDEED
jgi:replication initiation and membrane attachment protein DnaB